MLLFFSSNAQATKIDAYAVTTASRCSVSGGYVYDGYIRLADWFPAPYTITSVSNTISGSPIPTVFISGDTLKVSVRM